MKKCKNSKFWRMPTTAILLGLIPLMMTGCILRNTGGFVFTDDLRTFIRLQFDNVSVAYCREVNLPDGGKTVECEYSIETADGFADRTSTTELISQFGVLGILIDPVIMQIHKDSTVQTATVDDGNGPQPLRITETATFAVQPGVQSAAEPGHKFWIIELPETIEADLVASPDPLELDYVFEFFGPPAVNNMVPVKAIYAGRVEVGGDTFYPPLYPCTADFTQVPEIQIPVAPSLSGFIFELLFQFGDFGINPDLGCNGQVYDFSPTTNDQVPDVPQNLIGRTKGLKVNVVWDLVANATNYIVFRRLANPSGFTEVGQSSNRVFVDQLPPGASFAEYVVVAENDVGRSGNSDSIMVTSSQRRRR